MLIVAIKNIPIKAHRVPPFMWFNKIYGNLPIVCIFGTSIWRRVAQWHQNFKNEMSN